MIHWINHFNSGQDHRISAQEHLNTQKTSTMSHICQIIMTAYSPPHRNTRKRSEMPTTAEALCKGMCRTNNEAYSKGKKNVTLTDPLVTSFCIYIETLSMEASFLSLFHSKLLRFRKSETTSGR